MSRIIAVISLFLFWNHLSYAQQEEGAGTIQYANPILVELEPNVPIMLTDSLSILLTGYSHKRPTHGASGQTKTGVQLSLSKGNNCGEIEVYRYGLQGETAYTYAPSSWNDEYEFKLKDFDFPLSFKIVISKKQDTD
ncbi:hypothetical protein [Aquimarina atlantica]|nr:hypothetical protein [Aquimarina atlantica]